MLPMSTAILTALGHRWLIEWPMKTSGSRMGRAVRRAPLDLGRGRLLRMVKV